MGEGSDARAGFPLGFSIASIACTSLGLVAAAGNVQWGVATGRDAVAASWVYVNVCLMIAWLVLWPAMCRTKSEGSLDRQLWAMAIGAIPAMAVSAFLSGANGGAIFAASMLQVSIALFAWGVLSISGWKPAVAALLPVMALALPVAAFIIGDTFPKSWQGLQMFVPPIAVVHAARLTSGPSPLLYVIAITYTVLGFAGGIIAMIRWKKLAAK